MPPRSADPDVMRRHEDIHAGEVETFELWFAGEIVGTERGYGIDHSGAAIPGALTSPKPWDELEPRVSVEDRAAAR